VLPVHDERGHADRRKHVPHVDVGVEARERERSLRLALMRESRVAKRRRAAGSCAEGRRDRRDVHLLVPVILDGLVELAALSRASAPTGSRAAAGGQANVPNRISERTRSGALAANSIAMLPPSE
jgi:hypothetical protein